MPRRDAVRTQFLRTCRELPFALHAYCFMPDHVHLLIEALADDSDCCQFISRAKQYSGFYYRKAFGEVLWQRYGYERALRSQDDTLSVVRYILENPVRARLVERVEQYPFLGSGVYPLHQVVEAVQLREGSYR